MNVLVVTPTLAQSRFLVETVASVRAVQPRCRHVLVCPHGAEKGLRSDFPETDVLPSHAKGVYAAVDDGLRRLDGWDCWTWLNDDDRFRPEAVSRALGCMEEDADCDVVYGRVRYIDAQNRDLGPVPIEPHPARLRELFAAGIPALSQHGTFVRRSIAQRLDGFNRDWTLGADFDYWVRAVLAGAQLVHHPEVVADYRLRTGQLSSDTGALSREIAAIAARHFDAGTRGTVRLAFRIRHLPGICARFLATGCFRTSSVHRRIAKREART